MMSRITGANTGKWVRLFNDLARTTTTPEASTGQWLILVTLEADQAVQEARLPERVTTNTQAVLRLAKGNQSCNQNK